MKRLHSIFFLFAALFLWAGTARALLVSVEVMWDNAAALSAASLQVNSIVQIVAFDSTAYGARQPDPSDPDNTHLTPGYSGNFTPYGSSVYLPDTTPSGHEIIATGRVQDFGDGTYGLVTWVDLEYPYDSLYVRVFNATNFYQGVVSSNVAWGISGVTNIYDDGSHPLGTAFTWFDNVQANNTNHFELIPEPSSLAFLLSGGCGMGAFALFRRRRSHPTEE